MNRRVECEPDLLRTQEAAAIKKAAMILGRPLMQAVQLVEGLPTSTLEVILGRTGSRGSTTVNFPKEPTDPNPLPPAA